MSPGRGAQPEPAVHHGLLQLLQVREAAVQNRRFVVVSGVPGSSGNVCRLPQRGERAVCLVPGMWPRWPRGTHQGVDGQKDLVPDELWTSLPVSLILNLGV